MHLQKFLVILSSLTVVGFSAPVVSQEENFEITEYSEPKALILAQHSSSPKTHYISPITESNAAAATDKTIERALGRKNLDEPLEILVPTSISKQKKRGDDTIVWVPPPPTSKIPLARGDATVVWVQPPPTSKIPV
ncbi:uncharacterized protein EAF01_008782 [Botrytis porri]|uniref:Uncharacterized protein n=1 Tax=Botrytis porri TaxID=87229 RepID=A0A4Z1KZ57_9HELO|nr:uncharacterized protein EAF01_008782 [Botrytis porri]KAF7897816.1 hypothetical protein EAF01_008782 [Botrytis porri]TGO89730.1 hypothetical protein BPOR_0096g00110 [Botrytis porri]